MLPIEISILLLLIVMSGRENILCFFEMLDSLAGRWVAGLWELVFWD